MAGFPPGVAGHQPVVGEPYAVAEEVLAFPPGGQFPEGSPKTAEAVSGSDLVLELRETDCPFPLPEVIGALHGECAPAWRGGWGSGADRPLCAVPGLPQAASNPVSGLMYKRTCVPDSGFGACRGASDGA